MMKTTVLSLLIACVTLASTQALVDMHDRLKGRVVHIETLIKRGRWLWQNDNKDDDGSRYLYFDELNERDTYYQPRVQFQAMICREAEFLCFESLSLRDYYLTAGFPASASKFTVKLQRSSYIHDDDRFHWKVKCKNEDMNECKVIPARFESDGYFLVADDWGSVKGYAGGHYDATLNKTDSNSWFRVHAPNPTDGYKQVYSNTNRGSTDQEAQYSTTIGVSQSQSSTHTLTTSVSVEIGGAFKAFSASASASIENSWENSHSSTFEQAKTVSHTLTIPARTTIVLKQLIGSYAGEFDVADDQYWIEETKLDSGEKTEHAMLP